MYLVTQHPDSTHKRPLGVTLLALLMFLVGGLWLLAAVALPLLGVLLAPWYIHLAAAAYFLVVGWGLWGVRRWAYFTALLMCVVLAFYQLQTAIFLDQNVLAPLLILILIFGYLLLPRVRVVFLTKDEARGSRIEDRG
jgi:hypothetical protein